MNEAVCPCGGEGVVLVEGPCDAAPLEAPCPLCLPAPSGLGFFGPAPVPESVFSRPGATT